MCFGGGPKVDNSVQIKQQQEAAEARRREQDRQTRIKTGTKALNALFGGGVAGDGALAENTAFDPKGTYFLADGSRWTPQNEGWTPDSLTLTPQQKASGYEINEGKIGKWVTTPGTPARRVPDMGFDRDNFHQQQQEIKGTAPTRTFQVADDLMPAGKPWTSASSKAKPRTAQEQFQEMLKNGALYSGTKQVRGFDDEFYADRRNSYMDYYQPQLDDQFGKATDQLTYALARAGTLNSTVAADKQADLQSQYGTQKASILSQANDAVNQHKARVNQEKSALLAQLNATGDANMASNEALARTQQLFQQQPTYNALPDLFAGAAAGIGNWAEAAGQRRAYNAYFGSSGGNRNTRMVGV